MIRYITISEAARIIGVSRQTIYSWIKMGKLKPIRTAGGRLRITDNQLIIEVSPETTPSNIFPIIDISKAERNDIENLGTKLKFWFSYNESKYLFKEGRRGTGENWAEKVASELCDIIGIPHARYELARYGERKGVICATFVPEGASLVHGNELLAEIEPGYEKTKRFKQSEHTLGSVLRIIGGSDVEMPVEWNGLNGISSAQDVFVGYLMLDVLIANQDRHHENWAFVKTSDGKTHLAPSYDHASSLGVHELDINRQARLNTKDSGRNMASYVAKATSAFYSLPSDIRPISTLDTFYRAGCESREAARSWLNKLDRISEEMVRAVFDRIPREDITEVSSLFAQKVIELNKRRLLELGF